MLRYSARPQLCRHCGRVMQTRGVGRVARMAPQAKQSAAMRELLLQREENKTAVMDEVPAGAVLLPASGLLRRE